MESLMQLIKIKSTSLLLVILLLPLLSYNQSISPNSYAEYDGNDYFIAHNIIANNTNKAVTYRWVRTVLYLPKGWQTSICDPSYCHSATKDSSDMVMPAGKTGQLDCNFYLGQSPEIGTAQVELKIFPINNRTDFVKVIFQGKLLSINSVEATYTFDQHITVYYNRELGTIELKSKNSNHLNMINIKNVFGNVVYSLSETASSSMSVSTNQFAKGVYFLLFTTPSGLIMRKKLLID